MDKIRKVKGTQDILPGESEKWLYLEGKVRAVMQAYGYREIRTPVFESTALFSRGIGQLTDIVTKEMYTFEDRGGKSNTLKPEGTAPVIRAYLENGMANLRPVQKLYYISPMFRQENPQAGRFRQFHQFGAELIGVPGPLADVETILLALDIYKSVGLSSFKVKLNSVGDQNCRAKYKQVLSSFLEPKLAALCKSCQTRFASNPMRILDCKKPPCQSAVEGAPKMIDYLDEASATHFKEVCDLLDLHEISYELDSNLVRGLDYYTRTAYEIISDDLGSQNALCGGGRYDLLAEELGGRTTPSVGFAAGIERLLMVLASQDLLQDLASRNDVFIVALGEEAVRHGQRLSRSLRQQGLKVDLDFLGRSLKAQLKEANRTQTKYVIIIGESELEKRVAILRNLNDSEQREVAFDVLVDTCTSIFQD